MNNLQFRKFTFSYNRFDFVQGTNHVFGLKNPHGPEEDKYKPRLLFQL